MVKILLVILLIAYQIIKYKLAGPHQREAGEGEVLYPRQSANAAFRIMTLLQAIFLLEFISHAERSRADVYRLVILLLIFASVDIIYYLKLRNNRLTYHREGFVRQDLFGRTKGYEWSDIKGVKTLGDGLYESRSLKFETSQGNFKVLGKSGGLTRFRRRLGDWT